MPDRKPLAEVLTSIYVDELKGDPGAFYRLPAKKQAKHMGAMAEVIRTLNAFGLEIAQAGDGFELRPAAPAAKEPKKTKPLLEAGPGPSPTDLGPQRLTVAEARQMGFEGDACPTCGAMRMVRNGSCLKCTDCGSTTGCS